MKFTKLLSVILACVMLMGVFAVLPVSAAEEASLEIVYNNVTYGSQQKLMYAVSAPEGEEVKLILCDAEGNAIKEAEYAGVGTEADGPAEGLHIFLSDGMPAHNAADKIYAYAEIVGGEKTEVCEYSVLEYLYKAMFVATTLTEEYVDMCRAHYDFALASQKVLDAEATPIDSFVYVMVAENGTVGGKTAGMYSVNDVVDGFASTLDTSDGSTIAWDVDVYNVATGVKTKGNVVDGVLTAPNFAAVVVATPSLVEADLVTYTATKSVADLITEYGWTSTTTKQSFNLDDKVSVKINGGSNTGKAYDGNNIRIYATDNPAGTITISVPEGYELVSVNISTQTGGTYAFLYVEGDTVDISNVETAVSGTSVVLNSVKNGTNGKQVRVTALEVVYKEAK